jgi:hypothetical protein
VRAVSSQYGTTSYSASRVLGPPDVFPGSGDNGNAWCPQSADSQGEFIEVAYDPPRRMKAVEIYETYSPGAVSSVEVITADGEHRFVYQGKAVAAQVPALKRRVDFACTDSEVVGVRVTLDSAAVPGWNELDAIGAVPCE